MIEPQILYGVTCDRCGETLINSNDNSAWYDRSTAEEEASEEDWHSVSSHHYCPNCYREDDDGNRTIKAPFPYYVQKINRFMNRIAKSYPCRIVEEDDHFALHGNTQDGKQLAPCDEEWVRSYAADKLLGIQMIDKDARMPNISSDYAKNRTMKINRQINECHCYNCRKYEECQTKGVFDDDPGFDFCVNYEDVSYPDDDNDEND